MGDGWKVGLASISLPDSKVDLSPLTYTKVDVIVMSGNWCERKPGKTGLELGHVNAITIHTSELEKDSTVTDNSFGEKIRPKASVEVLHKAVIFKIDRSSNRHLRLQSMSGNPHRLQPRRRGNTLNTPRLVQRF